MRKFIVVAVLAALTAVVALAWATDFMTDAATRLARDLRKGADGLAASREPTIVVVVHWMKPSPEGCSAGYRVQLTAASALVVWCRSEDGQRTVSSHTTTSHLPVVDVPLTWIVDKQAGEPTVIELERSGTKAVVTSVH